MGLKGTGKYHITTQDKNIIHIHTNVAKDSAFPFSDCDDLRIIIDDKRLIIEKK